MTAYFESLSSEGFPLTDCPRIRRLHSDRAGEFTAPFFEKFLSGRKGIYHTLTTGYDPQANGTAERTVGLLKAISARCLSSASLDESYWSYAVRYAAQSLLCAALQKPQRSPPFGAQVVAQALGHGLIKYPQQRAASSSQNAVASLDITAAFLNAELPAGRTVILRPPSILYKLGLLPPGSCWKVNRAVYGLREAPNLWSEERTSVMSSIRFRSHGETIVAVESEIHKSLYLLVKQSDMLYPPEPSVHGLTKKIEPSKVLGLIGIYVDDYLATGPKDLISSFFTHLRKTWKTSDPVFLEPGVEFTFLGINIERLP